MPRPMPPTIVHGPVLRSCRSRRRRGSSLTPASSSSMAAKSGRLNRSRYRRSESSGSTEFCSTSTQRTYARVRFCRAQLRSREVLRALRPALAGKSPTAPARGSARLRNRPTRDSLARPTGRVRRRRRTKTVVLDRENRAGGAAHRSDGAGHHGDDARPWAASTPRTAKWYGDSRKARPVSPADVIALSEEMCAAPFRTLFHILTGSDRMSPCPFCGKESLVALNHVGKCYGCGKVNFERLCERAISIKERHGGLSCA